MHLINYDYSEEKDGIVPADKVRITLRDVSGRNVRVFRLDGETDAFSVSTDGETIQIDLFHVPVYTAVEISG